MNEAVLRNAIKNLIDDNKGVLVTGLSQQGSYRSIKEITYSTLTPNRDYYFISISVDREALVDSEEVANKGLPLQNVLYDVSIELVDFARAQQSDSSIFEGVDWDFQLLGDRIVGLLATSRWITDSESGLKYRINNRSIVKENRSQAAAGTSQLYSILYSRIKFQALQECLDWELLY